MLQQATITELDADAGYHLTQPYEGLPVTVYSLRIGADGAHSLVHPQGTAYAFGRAELVDLLAVGILRPWRPDGARGRTECKAQLIRLRAAAPMRSKGRPTHDVDGLGLFDHARQPSLF